VKISDTIMEVEMVNNVSEELEKQAGAMDIYGMGGDRALTPEMISSLQTLSTGVVPPEAIQERPGEGLGMWWSYDVQDARMLEDGTAMAIVTLKIHLPLANGEMFTNSVTEVGAWEDSTGKMPHAMRIASAVSRGLARCAMRRFGIGEEFYHSEDGMSVEEAYEQLKAFAFKRGLDKDEFNVLLHDMEIGRENLVDNYMVVWRMIIERTVEE
jgi:hypothetical protein